MNHTAFNKKLKNHFHHIYGRGIDIRYDRKSKTYELETYSLSPLIPLHSNVYFLSKMGEDKALVSDYKSEMNAAICSYVDFYNLIISNSQKEN